MWNFSSIQMNLLKGHLPNVTPELNARPFMEFLLRDMFRFGSISVNYEIRLCEK